MALHRLFQLSSVLRSAVSLTLRRNIGLSAVVFNRTKELDPVQKLFLDKIRDYTTKSKSSGGIVDSGPDYQKNLSDEATWPSFLKLNSQSPSSMSWPSECCPCCISPTCHKYVVFNKKIMD
uniref:ATP synthase peripheral stalk subunit F6, mitochondrial n=1 Tax=Gasterosteus aculeatus aculeatus TaxID=481459 RepID=A0AAQ4RDY2_GASAC